MPKVTLAVPTEAQEQIVLANFLDMRNLLWAHVPNGGFRRPWEAKRFKSMGVKRGVPDILIFTPPPNNPDAKGCAIELKRLKGGALKPEQKMWLHDLEVIGWVVLVCKGALDASGKLCELGY